MNKDRLAVRVISFTAEDGQPCTLYAALTDAELAGMQAAGSFQEVVTMNRLLNLVRGREATEADEKTALDVFAHIHGKRAIPHP